MYKAIQKSGEIMKEIIRLFPEMIQNRLIKQLHEHWHHIQEIRIRLDKPIELIFDRHTEWMTDIRPSRKDTIYIMNQLSEFSLYRMEDELREGYITIEGGHRVGLAGKVNTLGGEVKAIQHITFMNIRVAKEKIGVALPFMPFIYNGYQYDNTLLVGAPQTGKTTIIRDMARMISDHRGNTSGKKVGIVDERSEISGSIKGIPQHTLGLRADVMDACPKAEGMMMMIRSMSPEVLIVDEIGNEKDVAALMEAINAGVTIICSIHAQTLDDLKKRPSIRPLFMNSVFKRIILLERGNEPGKVGAIYNEFNENIYKKYEVLKK